MGKVSLAKSERTNLSSLKAFSENNISGNSIPIWWLQYNLYPNSFLYSGREDKENMKFGET